MDKTEQLERVARAIDPMAFEEWKTPPRGLELMKPELVHLEQLRAQSHARQRARAVLEALRPELEDAERVKAELAERNQIIRDAAECMGEAVHTAFRKGCSAPQAREVWALLRDMPRDDFGSAMDWITDCLNLRIPAAAIDAARQEGE